MYKPDDMKPLFKREKLVGKNRQNRTQSLFYENRYNSLGRTAYYNFKEVEWEGTVSMYRVYMNCHSEYQAAFKILGSWRHWLELCNCDWFKEHIDAWRQEMLIRDAAYGKAVLIKTTLAGSVPAARVLYDEAKKQAPKAKQKSPIPEEKIDDFITRSQDALGKGDTQH